MDGARNVPVRVVLRRPEIETSGRFAPEPAIIADSSAASISRSGFAKPFIVLSYRITRIEMRNAGGTGRRRRRRASAPRGHLPVATFRTAYDTNPNAMPSVMLTVRGIITIVRKRGNRSRWDRSIRSLRTFDIIMVPDEHEGGSDGRIQDQAAFGRVSAADHLRERIEKQCTGRRAPQSRRWQGRSVRRPRHPSSSRCTQ